MQLTLKHLFGITAAVFALSVPALPQESDAFLLPPNAKPGECYARVFVPPAYETRTERILAKPSYKKLDPEPARYEWQEQTVTVKEASERLEIVPATYEWVEEKVLVKPASKKLVEVPAVLETVTEQVLDRPAHTVWKKGHGPIQKVDNATGEIMCLVEVPASYKTVTKQVLKSPATTREIEIPAEYETVRRQVVKTPPSVRKVPIPAEEKTLRMRKLVSQPDVRATEIPEEYRTVSKTHKVSDGRMEWRQVLCETNITPATIMKVQQSLKKGGYYEGPIDGVIGKQTRGAFQAFQEATNLPEGGMTLEALRKLGVDLND